MRKDRAAPALGSGSIDGWASLPKELLWLAMAQMDAQSQAQVMLTCRAWHEAGKEERGVIYQTTLLRRARGKYAAWLRGNAPRLRSVKTCNPVVLQWFGQNHEDATNLVDLDLSCSPRGGRLPAPALRKCLSHVNAHSGLTSLSLNNQAVVTIGKLEKLTNLGRLDLRCTEVCDLSPLSALTGLTHLDLFKTGVRKVKKLANLVGLRHLDLSFTEVFDLSPLSRLEALVYLCLRKARVDTLVPLAGLASLQNLDIGSTKVEDLGPLADLRQLEFLDASSTLVADLRPVSGLVRLRYLNLYKVADVQDLTPLARLVGLQHLDLGNGQFSAAPLMHLTALTCLYPAALWDQVQRQRGNVT